MLVNQIAVFLENRNGRICEFSRVLKEANINIAYLYSFARAGAEKAVILLKVDDNEATKKILADNGINLIEENIL